LVKLTNFLDDRHFDCINNPEKKPRTHNTAAFTSSFMLSPHSKPSLPPHTHGLRTSKHIVAEQQEQHTHGFVHRKETRTQENRSSYVHKFKKA
jgi:hypothetical protein